MSFSERRALILGLASGIGLLGLAGCGFEPIYAPGAPAQEMLGGIEVALIDGEPGFAMRERLTQRLGTATDPRYRLVAGLELTQEGAALTQQDYTTRYNVTGVARYELLPLGGGPAVLSGQVTSITGYSAPESENASAFASSVAKEDAENRLARTLADQIVTRLAITAGDRPATATP